MKTRLFVVALFVISIILAGCAARPETAVNSFIKALKKADFEKAATFIEGKALFEPVDKEDKKVYKLLFARLTHDIDQVEITGDKAEVVLNLTNLDFIVIGGKLLGELASMKMATLFNGEELTDLDINSLLIKRFTAQDAPKRTSIIHLELKKVDGRWLIIPNDELERSVLGEIKLLANLYDEIR